MAMSENSKRILKFLQVNNNPDVTAAQVSEELSIPKKTVDGSFTSFYRNGKNLGYRKEVEIETEDGKKTIKYLKLTDEGMAFDVDATE